MHWQIKSPKGFILSLGFIFVILMAGAVSAAEESRGNNRPVADVTIGSSGVHFVPRVSYGRLTLTVSLPDGTQFQKNFTPGATPYLELAEVCKNQVMDGHYTYELRVSPVAGVRVRDEAADSQIKAETKPQVALTQTGHFLVRGGSIVIPSNVPEPKGQGIARPDYTYNEDLYVVGSLCVGTDCSDPELWYYDVIRLKENNLRIHFDDTSSTSSFPANDWRILINDTVDGGGNYFAVEDSTSGYVPFKIEAGAPDNALYIEDYGRVGLGTTVPAVELHIISEDTPTMRLEQTSTLSAQVWDVAGNETNFFVCDVSNPKKLPFKIQPGTPSDTLCLKSDGKIGMGTWSPAYALEINKTGTPANFICKQTDGASACIVADSSHVFIGAKSNHDFRLIANDSPKITILPSGYVGFGRNTPSYPLHMSSGAYCTTGGVWTNASSRTLKENIQSLTTDEALNTLNGLNPVKFNYKADNAEKHVGFIAEDAPELVAAKDKQGMSPMDVVAVLTKVVQEQQKTIAQLQEKIAQLEKNK